MSRKIKKNKRTRPGHSFQKNKNFQQGLSLSPEQTYQFVVQYFQAGNFQQAEQFCRKLLEVDPANANANNLMGIIIARQGGRNDLAIGFIQKALSKNPDNADIHRNLGEILQGAGRREEAVISYQKALSLKPGYAEVLFSLGNVFQGLHSLEEAIDAYEKALNIRPDYAEVYNNLGVAKQRAGKHDEAITSYRQALLINPNNAEALNNLGFQLQNSDKLDEAIDCYRKAVSIKPDYAEAHNNLGNVLKELGKLGQAIASYRKALSLKPDYVKALNSLGLALHKSKEFDRALGCFKKALSLDPNFASAHNNLGVILHHEAGMLNEAKSHFEKALTILPDYAEVHLNLGSVNHELGRLDKAIYHHRKALALDPDYAEAHFNLGVVLNELGRLEEVRTCFEKALSNQPDHAEAFRHLSLLEKHTAIDKETCAMEELYSSGEIDDEKKIHLGFAFGKIYSDLKEYDKSFNFILEANRLKRQEYDFSIQKEKDFIERLKNTFSSAFFFMHNSTVNPDAAPIFILGMPRSGTTLVEQIISSHPLVYGAGELMVFKKLIDSFCSKISTGKMYPECVTDFDAEMLNNMGSKYIEEIREYLNDAEYVTNKMPHNFLFVGLIRIILPNAKVIHCTRNPMDNCFSIFKNVFRGTHNYAYDMVELGQYYTLYLDLMGHWEKVLPGYMCNIKYEEMVSDQENQSRRLLDFCDIPWDDACLSFYKTERSVRTASRTQVRQPIYKDSVELWKRYEKQLEPLRKAIYGK